MIFTSKGASESYFSLLLTSDFETEFVSAILRQG